MLAAKWAATETVVGAARRAVKVVDSACVAGTLYTLYRDLNAQRVTTEYETDDETGCGIYRIDQGGSRHHIGQMFRPDDAARVVTALSEHGTLSNSLVAEPE
jgi:hypothetical protein